MFCAQRVPNYNSLACAWLSAVVSFSDISLTGFYVCFSVLFYAVQISVPVISSSVSAACKRVKMWLSHESSNWIWNSAFSPDDDTLVSAFQSEAYLCSRTLEKGSHALDRRSSVEQVTCLCCVVVPPRHNAIVTLFVVCFRLTESPHTTQQ